MRQAFAIAALFGGGLFMYLWLGIPGACGYGFGLTGAGVTLGLASGYWVGFNPDHDKMVTELMRWAKLNRAG